MLRLAAYALKGTIPAILVVLCFAGLSLLLPVIGLFSSATVALVALRKGAGESFRVLLAAGTVLTLGGFAATDSVLVGLSYGALMWLPAWILALLLREMRELRWSLEVGGLVGLLAVAAVYGLVGDPATMWLERFQAILTPLSERAPDAEIAQIQQVGAWFSPFLTGMVAAGSVASVILSLFLARWWQACFFNPGGFSQEFTRLRYHKAIHYAGCILAVIAIATSARTAEVAWNLLIVLSVLFIILGLAILHRILAAKANKRYWLAGLYVLALFVPQALLPVALLGITDAWVDWRGRRLLD